MQAAAAFVTPSEASMPDISHDPPPEYAPDPDFDDTLQTDEQLMLAFARGSATATASFNTLFARYKQPLFGFFRRRLADPAYAEELTQDTFVAVLHAASRYQGSALFRTYLYAIAYKILRAHRRKAAFRAFFQGDAKPEDLACRATTDTDLVLRDALSRLDPKEQEILLLREFEQLSYDEIAMLLALPLNTVRSRLFRARSALRELLTASVSQPSSKSLNLDEERA